MQNRTQALGYCLWSMYNQDVGMKTMLSVFETLNVIFIEEREYDNTENLENFREVLKEHEFDEEQIKKLSSEMYWHFDDHTIEEAGDFYEFVVNGVPIPERRYVWVVDQIK